MSKHIAPMYGTHIQVNSLTPKTACWMSLWHAHSNESDGENSQTKSIGSEGNVSTDQTSICCLSCTSYTAFMAHHLKPKQPKP